MLVPVFAEVEAEPEAEPEAGLPAVESAVIVALVCRDGAIIVELEPVEDGVSVAVGKVMLVVVCVDTPPAVAVVVVEPAAVDEGGEAETVSWLIVGASNAEGTISPAGSHSPKPLYS